jgi:hypothetical protein
LLLLPLPLLSPLLPPPPAAAAATVTAAPPLLLPPPPPPPPQLYQARLSGADAVRLVAAALPPADVALFHKVTQKIGMQVTRRLAVASSAIYVY